MSKWTDVKIAKPECTVNSSACFHNLTRPMHPPQTEIIQVPIGTFMEVIIGAQRWMTKDRAYRCKVYIHRQLRSKKSLLKEPKACKPKAFRPRPSKGSCNLEPVYRHRRKTSREPASRPRLWKKTTLLKIMRQNLTMNIIKPPLHPPALTN